MTETQLLVRFTPLDWIWTALFIVLMTLCGVIFYQLGKKSESEFFLAGRGLPVPAACVERDWSQPYGTSPATAASR